MSVAAIEAHVEHGQILQPPNVTLPENSTVCVIVPDTATLARAIRIGSPRLARPEEAGELRKALMEEKK